MIYFDNAATGGFKPSTVLDTTTSVLKYLNANPGRSGHSLSQTAGDYVYSCRQKVCDFFGVLDPSKVIFCKNCTEALNIAILGSIKGGIVLTSTLEHNSVLRPLYYLEKQNIITMKVIKPKNNKFITLEDIAENYSSEVSAVCLNYISNVTGEISEIAKIGEFLKDKPTLFIVDGAQAGGHIPISLSSLNVDMLALAGHKGLYSIMGVGILLLSKNVSPEPITFGGTGTESFNPNQPDCYPERLESGTLNLPAICSLEEGIRYIENNLSFIQERLVLMTDYLISKLKEIDGVRVYSTKNPAGIVSFEILNLPSNEATDILSAKYNIACRGGYHCAPLVHKMLGTDSYGLIRASLCVHNTKSEQNALISAVKEIIKSF